MEPRKVVGRQKDNKKTRRAGKASRVFLSFALWFIVPNNCERRNNLPRIHGFLMDLRREWPISEWASAQDFFSLLYLS
jgi:hypothetical protein